jgi:hypothetical protein
MMMMVIISMILIRFIFQVITLIPWEWTPKPVVQQTNVSNINSAIETIIINDDYPQRGKAIDQTIPKHQSNLLDSETQVLSHLPLTFLSPNPVPTCLLLIFRLPTQPHPLLVTPTSALRLNIFLIQNHLSSSTASPPVATESHRATPAPLPPHLALLHRPSLFPTVNKLNSQSRKVF